MKIGIALSLVFALLSGCSREEPNFDALELRMSKSEVLELLGEPDATQFLVAQENGENTLVDTIPEEAEAILEHWNYVGNRTFKVTDERKYSKTGRTTVIFRTRDGVSLYSGSWFRDQEYLEAEARANET